MTAGDRETDNRSLIAPAVEDTVTWAPSPSLTPMPGWSITPSDPGANSTYLSSTGSSAGLSLGCARTGLKFRDSAVLDEQQSFSALYSIVHNNYDILYFEFLECGRGTSCLKSRTK